MKKNLISGCLLLPLFWGCFFLQPEEWGRGKRDESEISMLSWNVENLFDDVDNGSEYREYNPQNGWESEQFHARMIELTKVIESSYPGCPDILLLQEVENQNVLDSWNDRYLKNHGYTTVLAVPPAGRAITTGVISRLPLEEVRVHSYQLEGYSQARPIQELLFSHPSGLVRVFNNHWKSKLGGARQTEPMRRAAAAAINTRLHELRSTNQTEPVIIVGDLNEELDEYAIGGGVIPTALMPIELAANLDASELPRTLVYWPLPVNGEVEPTPVAGVVPLFSPWPSSESEGSYFYDGSWRKIDHVFMNLSLFDGTGWEWKHFRVVKEEDMLNSYGTPKGWNPVSGVGFSDHLPLLLLLEYQEEN